MVLEFDAPYGRSYNSVQDELFTLILRLVNSFAAVLTGRDRSSIRDLSHKPGGSCTHLVYRLDDSSCATAHLVFLGIYRGCGGCGLAVANGHVEGEVPVWRSRSGPFIFEVFW